MIRPTTGPSIRRLSTGALRYRSRGSCRNVSQLWNTRRMASDKDDTENVLCTTRLRHFHPPRRVGI